METHVTDFGEIQTEWKILHLDNCVLLIVAIGH